MQGDCRLCNAVDIMDARRALHIHGMKRSSSCIGHEHVGLRNVLHIILSMGTAKQTLSEDEIIKLSDRSPRAF